MTKFSAGLSLRLLFCCVCVAYVAPALSEMPPEIREAVNKARSRIIHNSVLNSEQRSRNMRAEEEASEYEDIYEKAERGDDYEQYRVGLYYKVGKFRGGPEKAVFWFGKAMIGSRGLGYEELAAMAFDYPFAMAEIKRLAQLGNGNALYLLGAMSMTGKGMPKDSLQALILLRKSAALGAARGQYQLGLLYENGVLVPRNTAFALAWLCLAERNPPNAVILGQAHEACERVKPLVSPKMLERVEAWRNGWKPGQPSPETVFGNG